MKMKLRKGDRVMVKRGSKEDKGKVGEVIRVIPDENRIVVQGINLRKKHQKATQSKGKQIPSGIIEFEAPIDASNVMLMDPKDNKPTKIRIERIDGVSVRISKRTGAKIDRRTVEKADKKTAEKATKKGVDKSKSSTAEKTEKTTAEVKEKKAAKKAAPKKSTAEVKEKNVAKKVAPKKSTAAKAKVEAEETSQVNDNE